MGNEEREGGLDASIIVALGGNLAADDETVRMQLERALARLPLSGLKVLRRSRFWRSQAWPDAADPPFLNLVALVKTDLDPERTLEALHKIEADGGRVRTRLNAPRSIDLDLIAYGRRTRGADPALPHPRAAERLFVMGPLAEIAPAWRHPVSGVIATDLALNATVGRDARPLRDDE